MGPEDLPRENDPRRPETESDNVEGACKETEANSVIDNNEEKEKMTLDKFLANHTSEDNESFIEIQEENDKKHRIKNAWMYKPGPTRTSTPSSTTQRLLSCQRRKR